MKSLTALLSTPLVVALVVAGQARADFMSWSYSTAATPPVIASGTDNVQLTGISNGTAGSSIPLLGIQESTATPSLTPSVANGNFSVAVKITDMKTNDTGTLTLSGTVTNSGAGQSASLGTNSLLLDNHKYIIAASSLPITVNAPQQMLVATIKVASLDGKGDKGSDEGGSNSGGGNGSNAGGAGATPEPASFVLGALGLGLVGAGGGWKRLRRRAVVAA